DLEDAYPMTRAQLGMVFHTEYQPGAGMFLEVDSWHLRGPLDVAALCTSVERVIARHAVLRTSFNLRDFSQPLQLVARTVVPPVHVEDLTHLVLEEEQDRLLAAWLRTERTRAFHWGEAPLIRFTVHRRSETS